MDERDGPDSDSDWEWLHELCKRPPPPAAADPGARSEWFEELLGNKEAARAGQQPGLTGAAVSQHADNIRLQQLRQAAATGDFATARQLRKILASDNTLHRPLPTYSGGGGVSGTAARRELPEEVARAGQQAGLTGAGVSGTAARPDRLRGERHVRVRHERRHERI